VAGQSVFVFPKWTNGIRTLAAVGTVGGGLYVAVVITFGFSPQATDVGYMPEQPVPYSHRIHAGVLGLDCRYCHNTVERAAKAAVPPVQTCINCHNTIAFDDKDPRFFRVEKVKKSFASATPIAWVRVHDLPDYAYFNHSAHVTRGIGCVTCHGRIDSMDTVYQAEPLSMSWCVDCHRNPERFLRPLDQITNMTWVPDQPQAELGAQLREKYNINPSTDCSTCHR